MADRLPEKILTDALPVRRARLLGIEEDLREHQTRPLTPAYLEILRQAKTEVEREVAEITWALGTLERARTAAQSATLAYRLTPRPNPDPLWFDPEVFAAEMRRAQWADAQTPEEDPDGR